jgi:cobalt-zinc-cadmium efflux system membrane fusion protein
MSTLETKSAAPTSRPQEATDVAPRRTVHKPPRAGFGRFLLLSLLVAAAAGGIYAYAVGVARFQQDVNRTISYVNKLLPAKGGQTETSSPSPGHLSPLPPWDGTVKIDPADAHAIGLLVVAVQPQTQPIKLDLPGRTDYDPNTLTKIRPRFDTLVEKVHIELGQKVSKGDPLVDLFSTELAQAKNDFQIKYVQWQHDLRLLELRETLFKTKSIAEQLLVDTRNDESKSRLDYITAREKLRVFGVPEDHIDPLILNLKSLRDLPNATLVHNVTDKARMTRLSPVDGIVIAKDVAPGNLYDNNDVLMTIAPLDHLFVWVNVYEAEQAQVTVGQQMEIRFPYLNRRIERTVEYVAPEVSKDTHAIKIRASIPNIDGKLKADMLVRAALEIPPVKGQVVIPRQSMVVMNGRDYAFVRKPLSGSKGPERFERRELEVSEERDDHVVVKRGLSASEEVASNGSLILAQLYEDQQMVATGMPLR